MPVGGETALAWVFFLGGLALAPFAFFAFWPRLMNVVRRRGFYASIAGGLLAAAVTVVLGRYILTPGNAGVLENEVILKAWIRPTLEEGLKAGSIFGIGLLVRRWRQASQESLLSWSVVGALVGAGFMLGEIGWLTGEATIQSQSLGAAVFVNEVPTNYLHILTSGLVGAGIWLGIKRRHAWAVLILGAGLGFHVLNNWTEVAEFGVSLWIIPFGLLYVVSWYELQRRRNQTGSDRSRTLG